MKRTVRRILFALLLVCVYIVWHPEPTRSELVINAEWAVTPATAALDGEPSDASLLPVEAGSVFAYLTERGELAYRGRTAHRVTLSSLGFVNYSRTPEQLVVQDTSGDFVSSLPISGYPVFLNDRLFVVSESGGALSEWSMEGQKLWELKLSAPLTSIDASGELVALGLAAGGLTVLGTRGELVELQRPAVAAEPVVRSVALSEDGSRCAVIASARGAESLDATVTVYNLGGGSGVPVVRRSIADESDAAPLVRLTGDGRLLLYADAHAPVDDGANGDGGSLLVGLDIETGDEFTIPLVHPAADVAPLEHGLSALLSVSPTPDPARAFARPSELSLFAEDGIPLRTTWAADESSIAVFGSLLAIRVDDRIVAARIGVE